MCRKRERFTYETWVLRLRLFVTMVMLVDAVVSIFIFDAAPRLILVERSLAVGLAHYTPIALDLVQHLKILRILRSVHLASIINAAIILGLDVFCSFVSHVFSDAFIIGRQQWNGWSE